MIQRSFYPGDEWVYYKLYCHPSVANDVLLNKIYPLLNEWKLNGLISRWFFIRYADPLPHLRIRFELSSIDNLGKTLLLFKHAIEPYISNGIIHKCQIDTYVREIERYGIGTIEQCENFFYGDSVYVANFLENNRFSEIIYIQDSIHWISSFLAKINLNDTNIMNLAIRMSSAYSKEMNITTNQKVYIDSIYRTHKQSILKALNPDITTLDCLGELKWLNQTNINPSIIPSLIHMHINRLFPNNQRLYEYIVYYLFLKAFNTDKHMNKLN